MEKDERDVAIIERRMAELDKQAGPRVGDFVWFADGTRRRIAHDWGDEVQTSTGGSFYLGDGYVSFSGSLFPCVAKATLGMKLGGHECGSCWIFHHDSHCAHNGVDAMVPFRVFYCSERAPS